MNTIDAVIYGRGIFVANLLGEPRPVTALDVLRIWQYQVATWRIRKQTIWTERQQIIFDLLMSGF